MLPLKQHTIEVFQSLTLKILQLRYANSDLQITEQLAKNWGQTKLERNTFEAHKKIYVIAQNIKTVVNNKKLTTTKERLSTKTKTVKKKKKTIVRLLK